MSYLVLAIASSVIAPWSSPGLNQDPEPQDAAAIYRNSIESVVWVTNEGEGFSAIGTGFVVFDSSTIATSWHVIKDAKKITVRFSDGTEVKVDGVLGVDRAADLALLKIRKTSRKPLPIRKDEPEIGEQVFAIGNPRGLEFSIADGIISQMRVMYGKRHYQHSINTTQGNSGGPILDDRGRVVGVQRSGVRGESALKFASSALGLNEFDMDATVAPMPAEVSGTFAWRFNGKAIGQPQALAGRKEVLLVVGQRLMTLDVKTGETKSDVRVRTAYMPDGFVSNRDGSTIAIMHGPFRMAVLHRSESGEYSKREDASALWTGPFISDGGTVFNIGGTLGENQSISKMRLEATDAKSEELLWSTGGSDVFDHGTSPGGRVMVVRSKYVVMYDESFDEILSVYDAGTGDFVWKSERVVAPVGSPLGLIYYSTVQYAPTYNIETGVSTTPPRYVKGVVAATGREVYSRLNTVDDISVGPDGTVYLAEDGDLVAMNPELTEVKWRLRLGSPVTHHAVFDSEGSLFAPLADGRMIAVDASSGRLRWSHSTDTSNYFSASATVEDGVVVAKTRFGSVFAIYD